MASSIVQLIVLAAIVQVGIGVKRICTHSLRFRGGLNNTKATEVKEIFIRKWNHVEATKDDHYKEAFECREDNVGCETLFCEMADGGELFHINGCQKHNKPNNIGCTNEEFDNSCQKENGKMGCVMCSTDKCNQDNVDLKESLVIQIEQMPINGTNGIIVTKSNNAVIIVSAALVMVLHAGFMRS